VNWRTEGQTLAGRSTTASSFKRTQYWLSMGLAVKVVLTSVFAWSNAFAELRRILLTGGVTPVNRFESRRLLLQGRPSASLALRDGTSARGCQPPGGRKAGSTTLRQ